MFCVVSETAEPSAPPMLDEDDPGSGSASIQGGTIPAIHATPTKNPSFSPLYTYASPEHRRQLLLTAKQRSGLHEPTAPLGAHAAGEL